MTSVSSGWQNLLLQIGVVKPFGRQRLKYGYRWRQYGELTTQPFAPVARAHNRRLAQRLRREQLLFAVWIAKYLIPAAILGGLLELAWAALGHWH